MWGVTAELERRQVEASYWTIGLWCHLLLSLCRDDVVVFERCCENCSHRLFVYTFSLSHISHWFCSQALLSVHMIHTQGLPAWKCHRIASHLISGSHNKGCCDFNVFFLEAWWLRIEKQDCHLMAKIFNKQYSGSEKWMLKAWMVVMKYLRGVR